MLRKEKRRGCTWGAYPGEEWFVFGPELVSRGS